MKKARFEFNCHNVDVDTTGKIYIESRESFIEHKLFELYPDGLKDLIAILTFIYNNLDDR